MGMLHSWLVRLFSPAKAPTIGDRVRFGDQVGVVRNLHVWSSAYPGEECLGVEVPGRGWDTWPAAECWVTVQRLNSVPNTKLRIGDRVRLKNRAKPTGIIRGQKNDGRPSYIVEVHHGGRIEFRRWPKRDVQLA